ncbi:hypothetical protein BCV71DRAFT_240819 [Rhizopus microsporus]|uniref:Helitron helicase-like domain-containing protein n=1 Tax=Rhizopus microsporus TaxID=58291 RepID=A0A1X0SF43_RHIZD|nr:hypothetical protein BCV71DRAFT_240819 [Rhizopus microsporus]
MENNDNQSTTSCSSCHAPLPVDSRHRTCQACRERVAESRRRPFDAESRPRGRPRAEPAAYISQHSRLRPLVLGSMDKECLHCHALHWIDETQDTSSLRNPSWESCCKQGSVQLQLLSDPPEYLKDLLASTDTQGRHFKGNLRQYNAAFVFTSLGCDLVSAEDCANNNGNNNNNRDGLDAFQIHGVLCHRQGPLTLVESTMLAQCNPFASVYRHTHEILSNHETDSNNYQTETNTPYIVISPSMRMRLIEGGDRRIQNLPTMEEVTAVIPIKYSDRNFRDIVFTLRSNNSLRHNIGFEQHFQRISQTHAAYVCTDGVLPFPHGTCG